ncbi:MAG: peptide chain release factor 1 [Tepidiformaceae bacterium]
MEESVRTQLERMRRRYHDLTAEMGQPDVAASYERMSELARERSEISGLVGLLDEYEAAETTLEGANALMNEQDAEMRALASAEADEARETLGRLDAAILRELLPKDPRDAKNVIVEIRAGAGGEEAAIFAGELFRAYQRYAERRRWQTEVLNASESERGGFKEIVFEVRGEGAFSRLKYESGVHRVQRVPETETQGRIHTSTATVAVLPEADEVDIAIDEKELRVDIFHSSGAGGQNVNKVATAVRLTHIPTGIVVVCQDERSQMKNRVKAMTVMRSRLYDLELQKQTADVAESRRSQVGTGDRSEKIRTYNFPQDRITDHRVGLTVHNIPDKLDGNLDDIIDAVASAEEARLMEEAAV